VVPGVAIASNGPVASVALYTTKPVAQVRSIAMDTSSRTSVALVHVLCTRRFDIEPAVEHRGPDLADMLAHCDAGLIIGDNALLLDPAKIPGLEPARVGMSADAAHAVAKIDLGEEWTAMTGLPFVYAFWAGRPRALGQGEVSALQRARDAGVAQPERIARDYFAGSPAEQAIGARYLRDNIRYDLGEAERAGLELFYRYSAEIGLVERVDELRFY
jgi:chorismate dehydratase